MNAKEAAEFAVTLGKLPPEEFREVMRKAVLAPFVRQVRGGIIGGGDNELIVILKRVKDYTCSPNYMLAPGRDIETHRALGCSRLIYVGEGGCGGEPDFCERALFEAPPEGGHFEGGLEEFFAAFKARYPKRKGQQNWQLAKSRLKNRVGDAGKILMAVDEYARFCADDGKIGTEYVKQAAFWVPNWEEWYDMAVENMKTGLTRAKVRRYDAYGREID